MTLFQFQSFASVAVVGYVFFWCWQQIKRRRRTWAQIVSQLRSHDWGIEEISENYLYKSGIRATVEDIWPRIAGCEGLWAMYKNAPVLVQLADYAAEHGDGVDPQLLHQLRSDAFQIRSHVILALAQHAFSSASMGASENAHKAAGVYCALLARVTEMVQEHSARLFPSYLDAVA
jgi:hypothetical protein